VYTASAAERGIYRGKEYKHNVLNTSGDYHQIEAVTGKTPPTPDYYYRYSLGTMVVDESIMGLPLRLLL
jgi:hypothetical protein